MNILTIQTPKGIRHIGPGYPTFVIAEISCNHRQNYSEAVQLVHAAAKAGVDAVKFQTYTADTITMDSDQKYFSVGSVVGGKDNPKSWQKETLYSLYDKAHTPWEWQPELQKLCKKLGVLFFSTPFDETAVDFLEKLKVPLYKISSYENTHIPLIKKVAKTGKPVIISAGFASRGEVGEAIGTLRREGAKSIAVLHCLTSYASKPQEKAINLRTMTDIQQKFDVVTGLSDNNGGIEVPIMTILAGASIIEKHFNLRRGNKSFDDRFSIDPKQMKEMIKRIRYAERMLGKIYYGPYSEAERHNRNSRRSIFVSQDIKKGDKFTMENIRVIRPAFGLEPKYYEGVLGKTATKDIKRGTPLRESHVNLALLGY